MASVFIGTKLFRNIERLPLGMLEDLSKQAQAQLDNYDKYTRGVKSERAKSVRELNLTNLTERKDIVYRALQKKRAKEQS